MKTIKGPGIFLAQFAGEHGPVPLARRHRRMGRGLGYQGVQIPSWDTRLIDLKRAAESKTYCDEIKGLLAGHGLEITELSTHLQGQLVAVHPAYDAGFDGFAAPECAATPSRASSGRCSSCTNAAKASANLGLTAHATFSGALAGRTCIRGRRARPASSRKPSTNWRAAGARSSMPSTPVGVDVGYEIHPGEDLQRRRELRDVPGARGQPPARLPAVRPEPLRAGSSSIYLPTSTIPRAHQALHVKDAEFNPTGKQACRRFQSWINPAGRVELRPSRGRA